MTKWPKQSGAAAFYGNPTGKAAHANPAWEAENLVSIVAPFAISYAGQPIKGNRIRIHKKCADSLLRVLNAIWLGANKSQRIVDEWGMSDFSGSYNYRPKRGNSSSLSMHSYGCAVDFDADRNAFGDSTPHFAGNGVVLKAFADEGWTWGGKWKKGDGMHWQAADVG